MVFFKQLVLVAIDLLFIEFINGNTFYCDESNYCHCLKGNCAKNCTNDICQDKIFVCTNGIGHCSINCIGNNSCTNSTFHMASDEFHINCDGEHSCDEISIECGMHDKQIGAFPAENFNNNMQIWCVRTCVYTYLIGI